MRTFRAAFLVACLITGALMRSAIAQTQITKPSEVSGPSGSTSANSPCGMPAQLPLANQVKDPVWALLIGVSESNLCGVLTRARLELEVKKSGRSTRIPMPYLHALRRMPSAAGSRADVSLMFTEDLNLPVPYEILGYHPGRMRMTGDLRFKEWKLGRVEVPNPEGSPTVLEDVRVWGLDKGRVQMDVDGWLDAMLGPKLDDMDLEGFALCRYNGERMGFALGFGPKGS
ncbi:MAG TPA: hypothetical protein VFP10_07550, partial [Candidatus Eisenbacteria bacterium]|nr:hypothetical protein [Candidatus Eisenbacteria bacterium]